MNLCGETAFECTPADLHHSLWAKQHLVYPFTCSHQRQLTCK